jgi:hypothetical protein
MGKAIVTQRSRRDRAFDFFLDGRRRDKHAVRATNSSVTRRKPNVSLMIAAAFRIGTSDPMDKLVQSSITSR